MRLLKNRSLAFYVGFVLILTMAIGGVAVGAFADSGGASATVSAGTLSEAGDFSHTSITATLNGQDQTVAYTLPVQVTDATGSGAGWNLTISGTNLASGAHTLTQQVSAATAACHQGNGCTTATSTTPPTYPVVISATAQKFFSADVNSGLGIIDVSTTVQVVVPGNAYAGTYSTTLSLASVSGP